MKSRLAKGATGREEVKTEKEIRAALEALNKGDLEVIKDNLPQLVGHSRWNPNWVGRGFELGLEWVLGDFVAEQLGEKK